MKSGSRAARAPATLDDFFPDRLAVVFDLPFWRGARARGFAVFAATVFAGPALATLDCSFALRLECHTRFLSAAISSMVRPEAAEFDISSRISGSDFFRANS